VSVRKLETGQCRLFGEAAQTLLAAQTFFDFLKNTFQDHGIKKLLVEHTSAYRRLTCVPRASSVRGEGSR
jgi:hypothetical protein